MAQPGGANFGVSDLHALLAYAPCLMIFDGLDEVPDLATRSQVVSEVDDGLSRLSSVAKSLRADGLR